MKKEKLIYLSIILLMILPIFISFNFISFNEEIDITGNWYSENIKISFKENNTFIISIVEIDSNKNITIHQKHSSGTYKLEKNKLYLYQKNKSKAEIFDFKLEKEDVMKLTHENGEWYKFKKVETNY